MPKYTFTFDQPNERKYKEILNRLDEGECEYTIIEDIKLLDPEYPRTSYRQVIIETDPESCLTFRLGMTLKIRRERTEEELAAEKERDDRNTIRINVIMPGATGETKEE